MVKTGSSLIGQAQVSGSSLKPGVTIHSPINLHYPPKTINVPQEGNVGAEKTTPTEDPREMWGPARGSTKPRLQTTAQMGAQRPICEKARLTLAEAIGGSRTHPRITLPCSEHPSRGVQGPTQIPRSNASTASGAQPCGLKGPTGPFPHTDPEVILPPLPCDS